jgi:UDP-N-acetylmuramate dehydrogenase
MTIKNEVSLVDYSTMHLGGLAKYLAEIENKDDLLEALRVAKNQNLEVLMIGGGSNIIWQDSGFDGLVLVNKIRGFESYEDGDYTYLTIGAGEVWDEVVKRAADLELSGIEALSLIPGSAGATPVQNVGAYGQEISSVLVDVEAYDNELGDFVTLEAKDCDFSYRSSRFKKEVGRFYITSVALKLTKARLSPPFYSTLASYLDKNKIVDYSPMSIRLAVITIRNQKLPNPVLIHNCGSFFANPIISNEQFTAIQAQTELEIPHWETKDGNQKIAAGWLIENIGYKGYVDQETGMSIWPAQALVLVNDHAKTTADLLKFRDSITTKVKFKFGIDLVQEPQLLPTIAR